MSTASETKDKSNQSILAPFATCVLLLAGMIAVLRQQGRLWWCKCSGLQPWVSEALSSHTSQHLFDPYSFTHISHGFIFHWLLFCVARKVPVRWRFVIAMAIEASWEIFENTSFVINRYRETTAALGYEGDSIGNSTGDMISCGLGFVIANWLGWKKTLALFVIFETVLLITIKDSLLLNIFMLIYPNDALIQWQSGN